jgi:hypothetical protein
VDIKVSEGMGALDKILTAIGDAIPAHLRSSALDVSLPPGWFDLSTAGRPSNPIGQIGPNEGTDVVILFADGTRIDVSSSARFDLLGGMGARLKTVTAEQLSVGDQIVLLNEDARELFSERLIKALDQGPLKAAAEQRELWLTLVKLERATNETGAQTITRRMSELGHPVTPAAVRSWIDFEDNSDATVPNSRSRFLALAEALGLAVPESVLRKMFEGIRRVRTSHRVAGRRLGRAIRAAYLDLLDAGALSRIQREWGFDVVELVKSARVVEVDELILPIGNIDHVLD